VIVGVSRGMHSTSSISPERDYANQSVTFVRSTQGVETVGNISSPFCTLAIL